MIANSVAVDDSDAGACARRKRIQTRQLAVGTKITIHKNNELKQQVIYFLWRIDRDYKI
jgi:hypothetical protein